jgi:hypothetical protein
MIVWRIPHSTVTVELTPEEREALAAVADLKRKIMKYIWRYNKVPKPIRWTYANPTRRIA